MRTVVSLKTLSLIGLAALDPLPALSQSATVSDTVVAETENFSILCMEAAPCDADKVSAAAKIGAKAGLEQLQSAREWLESMGFPVARENLDASVNGTKGLRLQIDRATHEPGCGADAIACHAMNAINNGRMILPV